MPSVELARAAAELLTVGFQGRDLNDTLRRHLDRGVSGVVLFSRNLGTRTEIAQLIQAIKEYAGRPVFVAVDQEGGVVQRLRDGFTRIPPMRAVGSIGDAALTQRLGALVGKELRAVGVDVNFAPVLDVDTNPKNPVIGNRSFSRNPEVVAELGVAFARGLEDAGVASSGKHFPGHGDTFQDSHYDLPRLDHSVDRLRALELVPFRAFAEAGLASMMTAHVIFGALDDRYPATLSPKVLSDVLRTEIGYEGLVFSDDLEMKAIADHYGYDEAAILGIRAGVDNFLCCHTESVVETFILAVARAVDDGRVDETQFEGARERVAKFRGRFAKSAEVALSENELALDLEEGAALVAEIERRAARGTLDSGTDPTDALLRMNQEKLRKQVEQ